MHLRRPLLPSGADPSQKPCLPHSGGAGSVPVAFYFIADTVGRDLLDGQFPEVGDADAEHLSREAAKPTLAEMATRLERETRTELSSIDILDAIEDGRHRR